MKPASILLAALSSSVVAGDFQFDPNAHLTTTFGAAADHDESTLASHGHDPNDEFTLQGLELNTSLRWSEYLAGFIAYNAFLENGDQPDGEWEEAFIKLHNLPGGFEFRAGRMLSRITSQNAKHLHAWQFVDSDLITTRFLGDEGLITNSAEISWKLPTEHNALLSIAYGEAVEHEHAHEDDALPTDVHGEESLLDKSVLAIRLQGNFGPNDFNSFTYGASFLRGQNRYDDRHTEFYGGDIEYLWRENGLEAGGKHLRARLESTYRQFDYSSEDASVTGAAEEFGIHASLGWGFAENWEIATRYEFLEGIDAPVEGISERHRFSLALTRATQVNDYLSGHARLQYNHDHSADFGNEDSIWLQFQIDFGTGNEVR